MSELEDFGQVLIREVRDRAIRELFDRLKGSSDGTLSDESLRQLSSNADAAAIQDIIITAVDGVIAGLLLFLDKSYMHSKFELFSPGGNSVAGMSDGIHTEPFGPNGWNRKYSEYPV
jgi:hypothetical protein